MKHTYTFILISFFYFAAIGGFAQTDQERIDELGEISYRGAKRMYGKPLPAGEIIGTTRYSDAWHEGNVVFYNKKELKHHKLRFDIYAGIIETKLHDKVVAYRSEHIEAFEWQEPGLPYPTKFINSKNYSIANTELIGFFKVIVEGDVSLFSHQKIRIKEPDYIEGVDVGSRDYKVRKTEDFYLVFGSKLIDVSKGKKVKELKGTIAGLKEYVKQNKLNFKDEEDLVAITGFLNSINVKDVDL